MFSRREVLRFAFGALDPGMRGYLDESDFQVRPRARRIRQLTWCRTLHLLNVSPQLCLVVSLRMVTFLASSDGMVPRRISEEFSRWSYASLARSRESITRSYEVLGGGIGETTARINGFWYRAQWPLDTSGRNTSRNMSMLLSTILHGPHTRRVSRTVLVAHLFRRHKVSANIDHPFAVRKHTKSAERKEPTNLVYNAETNRDQYCFCIR